jgi:dolichol-phosphate mannosyltransferase
MCDLDIPPDTGDFRLIDRKVLCAMQVMREHHRFLRGLVPWVGFKSEAFFYDRDVRYAGVTKYSLRKMFRLAIDASMSFSRMPLRLATSSGVIVLALGSGFAVYIAFLRLFTTHVVPGLAAILALMAVLGGMQIIILGLIGEYVGKLFEEAKGRPLYVVSERRNLSPLEDNAWSSKEVRLANAVAT